MAKSLGERKNRSDVAQGNGKDDMVRSRVSCDRPATSISISSGRRLSWWKWRPLMDENTYFMGLKKETWGLAYLTPEKVQLALKARPPLATKEFVQQICIVFFKFFAFELNIWCIALLKQFRWFYPTKKENCLTTNIARLLFKKKQADLSFNPGKSVLSGVSMCDKLNNLAILLYMNTIHLFTF